MPLHPHISYTVCIQCTYVGKRKTRFIGHLLLKNQILDIS